MSVIVALDNLEAKQAKSTIKNILQSPYGKEAIFKLNDLLCELGLVGIKALQDEILHDTGKRIRLMLDPKWNDIPNTITNYMHKLAAYNLEPEYLTIMGACGLQGMKAAVKVKKELGIQTKLLAVSVLTSMDEKACVQTYGDSIENSVLSFFTLTRKAGMDGMVCSPRELSLLHSKIPEHFAVVTPGIRAKDADTDDQNRTLTPSEAARHGATAIVVGRPITKSKNPSQAFEEIYKENQDTPPINIYPTNHWEESLKSIGAFYERPENGKYVRLTSGFVSDAYINIATIERKPGLLSRAAKDLSAQFEDRNIFPDMVMGAQMGSVRLSAFLGKHLGNIESIYTEKDGEQMKLKRHDKDISGKTFVISEDVVTKGSTLTKMQQLIEEKGGKVLAIATLVNRH